MIGARGKVDYNPVSPLPLVFFSMPDSGVPCQLDFFRDFDFSKGEHPNPTLELHHSTGQTAEAPTLVSPPVTVEKPSPPSTARSPFTATELTHKASDLVASLGINRLARRVSVIWNQRMRTAAGRAFYDASRIELNPGLMKLSEIDVPAEIDRTLRHELAHLVAFHRARGRKIAAHGSEWRQACADLGIPGESRCHTLPFEPRRIQKQFVYECPNCDTEILRVRRFRHAVACYDCCRRFGDGRYQERFRLSARKLTPA